MHRVTRGYGVFGIVVPVVGIALAIVQGRIGEIWINISMILTAAAGGLLALQIYPRQRDALADPGRRRRTAHALHARRDLQPAVGGRRRPDDRPPRLGHAGMTLLRTLRLAAAVEMVSLVILLGNLLTTHTRAVAARWSARSTAWPIS